MVVLSLFDGISCGQIALNRAGIKVDKYYASEVSVKVSTEAVQIFGGYGYTKDFLFTFKNLKPSHFEKIENLEQLRVLEEGYKIKVIETKYETIGVDTAEDLAKLKDYLNAGKDL